MNKKRMMKKMRMRIMKVERIWLTMKMEKMILRMMRNSS